MIEEFYNFYGRHKISHGLWLPTLFPIPQICLVFVLSAKHLSIIQHQSSVHENWAWRKITLLKKSTASRFSIHHSIT